jgi:hypothetical protein
VTGAPVTRDDLEDKLREIEEAATATARDWSKWIIGGLVLTAAVVVGVGVMRRRRTPPITVEVYRNP